MKKTRRVNIDGIAVGGGAPVSVQTMTRTPTRDAKSVLEEIGRLVEITPKSLRGRSVSLLRELGLLEEFEGLAPVRCDIVRCAVPDRDSADALPEIVRESPIPVVADIHFNHRLALRAVEAGVAKLRINPGNLGGEEPTRVVAAACRQRGIPIRVGINAGSLEEDLRPMFRERPAQALARSALRNAAMVEGAGVRDIVISVKEHSAPRTIRACRLVARAADYPQHLGVTESGVGAVAIVRSIVGIGSLLALGVGDTIRVSLTEDPDLEVAVGAILARRKRESKKS